MKLKSTVYYDQGFIKPNPRCRRGGTRGSMIHCYQDVERSNLGPCISLFFFVPLPRAWHFFNGSSTLDRFLWSRVCYKSCSFSLRSLFVTSDVSESVSFQKPTCKTLSLLKISIDASTPEFGALLPRTSCLRRPRSTVCQFMVASLCPLTVCSCSLSFG